MVIKFEFFKGLLVEFCKEILQDERLKKLFEKAKSMNEIDEIMKNNTLSLTEKHIKMCKALIKDRIKQDNRFGSNTKTVFTSIVDSNLHPYKMIAMFEMYSLTNDLKE